MSDKSKSIPSDAEVANELPDMEANSRFDAALAKREKQKEIVRERTEVAGGPRMKLAVMGSIPGYHLFWENDTHAAIEQLLYEGFDFVKPSEVRMTSHVVSDADVGDRISRYVGVDDAGQPMRAYLMKCPEELWKQREQSRYAQADERDEAIRRTAKNPGQGLYNPDGVSILIENRNRRSS